MAITQKLIEQTRHFVEKELAGDSSGHDWWHIFRVWKIAIRLGEEENVNLEIVQLGALLHDIGDWKFHNGDESVGPRRVREFLERCEADESTISHLCDIVSTISFKGAGVATPMQTQEGKVVQDADRLDAIGAMGIARAFAYGGAKDRLMYHPDEPPVMHQSFDAYKKSKGHTINHFHEKLLLLKDRMNTPAGKRLAEERHRFMETFLQQFDEEWNGRA